jgi:uncharacterized lipoprotein YmbA
MTGTRARDVMRTPTRRRLCGLLVLLPLAACASAKLEWYRLTAIPGRPLSARPRRIELRDVRLARYLDRPEIVRAAGGTRLVVEDGQRWASPLDEMITQVLSQDLEQRLPGSIVLRERGSLAGEPELVAGVEIDRFETDGAGQAVLSAKFTVRPAGNDSVLRDGRVEASVAPTGLGTNALVSALSESLARLADRMVETLSA